MKPTLLVLAAGMGSRYGGLKQMDGLGPDGETIIDYSIYDAVQSGFGKVVYVVRSSFKDQFEQLVKEKYSHVKCTDGSPLQFEFVIQELDKIPAGLSYNPERQKPWGTAHAVLMAKDVIKEPFAVINADDYYGRSAFETMHGHLSALLNTDTEHAMVGFILGNTMSRSGTVSRAVCVVENGYLASMREHTRIGYEGDKIVSQIDGGKTELSGTEFVSMNFFGFTPAAFETFDEYFACFMAEHAASEKAEALLPEAASMIVREGRGRVKCYTSHETWFGMTYPEDRALVKEEIAKKITAGYYPETLWER